MRTILLACCIGLGLTTTAVAQTRFNANAAALRNSTVTAAETTPNRNSVAISRDVRNNMVLEQMPTPGSCKSGFVWREASAADRICAPPASRTRVSQENAQDTQNRDSLWLPNPFSPSGYTEYPGIGACKSGFVARAAYPGDAVCVTPSARDTAWLENTLASGRTNL